MWLFFGLSAITATLVNLHRYRSGKDHTLVMAIALSLTALTLCAEYSMIAYWTKGRDWAAIEDVVPAMNTALWVLTIASIVLNIFPIVFERVKRR